MPGARAWEVSIMSEQQVSHLDAAKLNKSGKERFAGDQITPPLTVVEQIPFLRSTLDGLSLHICVIDVQGRIFINNRAWREFAAANGGDAAKCCEGANYLEACTSALDMDDKIGNVASSIRAVINGDLAEFSHEYPCHSAAIERWYASRVIRFSIGAANYAVISHMDITERKLAERSLRRNRDLLNNIIEGTTDAVYAKDSAGRYIIFNKAAAQITGRSVAEVLGNDDNAIFSSDYAAAVMEVDREIRRSGDSRQVEHAHVSSAGKMIVAQGIKGPLRDDLGRVIGVFGISHDITESRLAEEEIRKLNAVLDHRVRERTEALAATINHLRDEIIERGKAEERTRRQNRLYAVLSETNQAIVRTKDRDTLFKEFCLIAVGSGDFKLAWVCLVDEESGELKTAAADGAIGYLDGISITANEESAGLGPTGISIREGTHCICNDFLNSPLTRPWHERGLAHGIAASASIALKQEGRVIGALTLYADKKDFFDRQQVDLLRQVGADVSFALDNMIRETRHREAETALREETAERLRGVETLREKERMLVQQSRMAAMGEMIGNIAHQWRQPLNLLGLSVQQVLMYYDLGECDRAFLADSVGKQMGLVHHMSQTINDFMNYFKPDKEKTEFKLKEAVANALSLLKGSLQSHQIGIEIIAQDDPVIYGYPNEFAQVLFNIVINAKDVLTERKISDPKVTITISSENSCAVASIADNGGGIPREIIGKIFDPYFTTKGPQGGTGIGLFMSKSIIEKNMGGSLTVRNITGGTEFRIEVRHGIGS